MNTIKIINHIIFWMKNYLKHSKMNGFILGVSGGIDSAVVSTLAAQTKHNVLVLEMPIHQEKSQIIRSKQHIQWLKKKFKNVQSLNIDLTLIFDNIKTTFISHNITKHNIELSLANTRSRLRMLTLYYYGGIYQYLVTGTGNKIEDFGIGFFTKYGDGGVDISPIADLLKSQIYSIGKQLQIITSIQNAEPCDGLWDDNRNDINQIGATYKELEWAMYNTKNNNKLNNRQTKILKIYKNLNKKNQHKFNTIPICKIPQKYL